MASGLFARRSRSHVSSPLRVDRQRNKLRSLTASGERITEKTSDDVRRLVQPWQARSFAYYDLLGEINYAAQFYARMLAPLRLFAAERDESGEISETTNPEAIDALERIQDPGGGRTGLLGTYGRLMFLTGECYLFVSRDRESGEEKWEMLSSDELRRDGNIYQRSKAPSLGTEQFKAEPTTDEDGWVTVNDETAVAYRLWQRHPRFSSLADSTMKGVLDLCEELLLLTRAVRARARSRTAGSGILWLDENLSPAPAEAAPDEDPVEDVFMSDLTDAMTTPIADEGSASAVVPLVVRVPVPDGRRLQDLVYHMQLVDPTQLYPETGLRYECIKRIALGLDMPPENLLGLGDSNHWSAWQIDEQTWKAHGQPKAQQFVDDLTASYYRPYLRAPSRLGDDAKRFLIGYDPAAVINHPDKTKDAKDLHDRIVIGDSALREAGGFTDADAPNEEERARMVGLATNNVVLAWTGDLPDEPEPLVEEPVPDVPVVVDDPETAAGVETAPPDETDAVTAAIHTARLVGAIDMALLRAREVAGARLRSLAKRDPDCRDLLEGVPSGGVAPALGRDRVRTLRAPAERDLVSGIGPLVADTVRVWGIVDERVVASIVETVEQHAARTLYDLHPRPLPDTFAGHLAGLSTNGR